MQRRPSGQYASIVVSRVRRPIPKRLANHEAQSIEEGGVKEGVDGDSRGLDEENKRREIPFDTGLVFYWSLAIVLHAGKKSLKDVLVYCNATRTDGCVAGCIRAALRQ